MEYKNFLIAFFLINSIFWGLGDHHTHCDLASKFGITECPPHYIHVYLIGLSCFIITLYLVQGNAGFTLKK